MDRLRELVKRWRHDISLPHTRSHIQARRDALRGCAGELEAALRWIPVSERLPESRAMVEVLTDQGGLFRGFYCGDLTTAPWGVENPTGGFNWTDRGNFIVTHWRDPFSSPPEANQ